jgi:hypothetical protein
MRVFRYRCAHTGKMFALDTLLAEALQLRADGTGTDAPVRHAELVLLPLGADATWTPPHTYAVPCPVAALSALVTNSVCVSVCVHAYMNAWACVCVCVCVCDCMPLCVCECLCLCVCVCLSLSLCVCRRTAAWRWPCVRWLRQMRRQWCRRWWLITAAWACFRSRASP